MDMFYFERELCELFKSKNSEFEISFTISSNEVIIYVRHYGDWDYQKG